MRGRAQLRCATHDGGDEIVLSGIAGSAAQARAAGSLGDRPLIVLTAGRPFAVGDPDIDNELEAFSRRLSSQTAT